MTPSYSRSRNLFARGNSARQAILRMLVGAMVLLAGTLALAKDKECTSPSPGAPMFITDDCVDPVLNDPYIDVDEMRTTPVPHRFVHGGFNGTDAKFSMAFPPADQYQGRFIEGPTHPLTDESISDTQIAFVIASGGYAVATNQGGSDHCTTTECAVFGGLDPTIGGYRVNAAAAKYSRELAVGMYGQHRPYGYIYGGSGGAYQTVSSAENTDIYDGTIPFVLGSAAAIPTGYTVRIHVQRIIGPSGKFPCILDAWDVGGSGDPYTTCGLTEEQAGALLEATRAGFPQRAWFGDALTGAGALPLIAGYPPYLDPTYFDDFWTQPGYLGHDDPYGSVAAARIQDPAGSRSVVSVIPSPFAPTVILDGVPAGDLSGVNLYFDSGAAAGTHYSILFAAGTALTLFGADLSSVNPGDTAHIDNSDYLALQTYHRHQIGGPDELFYPFDQFRNPIGDPNGTPIYPQRSVLTGLIGQHNGSGGYMTGVFHGKMMIEESLLDIDAHPYGADWYKRRVEKAMAVCTPPGLFKDRKDMPGKGKGLCDAPGQASKIAARLDENFRIYYQDYAQHTTGGGTSTRTVSYTGALQQELRDLARWAEQGIPPPASSNYAIENFGQVVVPDTAAARKGVQPVVTLRADGGVTAVVQVGQPVTLSGQIDTPPGGGKIISVEFHQGEGTGDSFNPVDFGSPAAQVEVEVVRSYDAPGTYFPTLRATSQREGDTGAEFARIDNIGRARVVVEAAP